MRLIDHLHVSSSLPAGLYNKPLPPLSIIAITVLIGAITVS